MKGAASPHYPEYKILQSESATGKEFKQNVRTSEHQKTVGHSSPGGGTRIRRSIQTVNETLLPAPLRDAQWAKCDGVLCD
jgi:hypothetical protein